MPCGKLFLVIPITCLVGPVQDGAYTEAQECDILTERAPALGCSNTGSQNPAPFCGGWSLETQIKNGRTPLASCGS